MIFAVSSRSDTSHLGIALAVFISVALFLAFLSAAARRKVFRECGLRLRLERMRFDSESVSGRVRGMHLRAHEIPGGKNSPPHMAIEVDFSPCELLVELRRQSGDEERAVAAGEAIDLETGDARFDRTWIVEGAPPERVHALLGRKKLRERLLEFAKLAEARVTIEDGRLSLYRRGTDVESGVVDDKRIQLALDLAAAAAVASEKELAAEPEIDEAASTYRATVRKRSQGESGGAMIQALRVKRAERRLREALPTMIAGHALAPGLALVFAFAASRDPLLKGSVELVGLGVVGLLTASAASVRFVMNLQRATPEVGFGVGDRAVFLASWVVFGAAVGFCALR
jgi:hypothetical protein